MTDIPADVMKAAEVPDLRIYGYAPGNYSDVCYLCKGIFEGDKRATTCRECAQRIHTAHMSHQAEGEA